MAKRGKRRRSKQSTTKANRKPRRSAGRPATHLPFNFRAHRFTTDGVALLRRVGGTALTATATTQPKAVELVHHDSLPPAQKGMYVRYDSKCADQHWGTGATVAFAMNVANAWFKADSSPTLLIGDLSAQTFSTTGCHSAHKTGTHVDFDLSQCLPSDPNYDEVKKKKCEALCTLMIQQGARRVLFNDPEVKTRVNNWAVANGFAGRVDDSVPGHDNHFHAELPL